MRTCSIGASCIVQTIDYRSAQSIPGFWLQCIFYSRQNWQSCLFESIKLILFINLSSILSPQVSSYDFMYAIFFFFFFIICFNPCGVSKPIYSKRKETKEEEKKTVDLSNVESEMYKLFLIVRNCTWSNQRTTYAQSCILLEFV